MIITRSKSRLIKKLAVQAKDGNQEAINKLMRMFNPLICKISEQIYFRYKKIFPLEEIIRQSRCAFIYLTVIHYDPNGKARFPYFIKKTLHAHLVQLYRPICISPRFIPLEQANVSANTTREQIYADERHIVYEALIKFIDGNFNARERDLIYNYFCGNVPRIVLVTKYHISRQRMDQIHHRVIYKLRQFLHMLGIDRFDDI